MVLTFSDVPSENVDATTATDHPDRRTRKRRARREALLDLAAELVERDGVDGLTMAALAEAADYAPASLYTYFGSRSALLAALQRRALATLGEVAEQHARRWDDHLARASAPDTTASVASLARLWAFSDRFLAAPGEHPREFRLQQQLLVTPGAEDTADAASVVPAAMGVLDLPRRLLEAARRAGALDDTSTVGDPIGSPLDPSLARTLAWSVAMNGALMADELSTGLPTTGAALGRELTRALLLGWGATRADLDAARLVADELALPLPSPDSPAGPDPQNGAPR